VFPGGTGADGDGGDERQNEESVHGFCHGRDYAALIEARRFLVFRRFLEKWRIGMFLHCKFIT
jgi:hypothetical protein